jgi:hypothetical protein
MTPMHDTRTREAFLEAFFDSPNQLTMADSLESPSSTDRLEPWIERFQNGQFPTALPRVERASTGEWSTSWYVFAHNSRQLRLAREEVHAFVGASYAKVDRFGLAAGPGDRIDKLVTESFPDSFRFSVDARPGVSYKTATAQTRGRLDLWLNLLSQRPVTESIEVAPVGQLIGQFDEQLRTSLHEEARTTLQSIESSGAVNQTNLAGLSILLHAAEGRSHELLDSLPSDFLERRLPRRVVEAILVAAYETFVPQNCPAAALLPEYRSEIRPRFAPLLSSSVGLSDARALTLLLLAAVASPDPDPDLLQSRADQAIRAGADSTLVGDLVAVVEYSAPPPQGPAPDSLQLAGSQFLRNDLDAAWRLALAAERSAEQLTLLVRIALEVDSAERLQVVSDQVAEASDQQLAVVGDVFLSRLNDRRQELVGADERIPQGWVEWAGSLADADDSSRAPEIARAMGTEWTWPEQPTRELTAFASSLTSVGDHSRGSLIDSLPYVVSALPAARAARTGLASVFQALIEHLVVDTERRPGVFVSLADLIDRWLEAGIDRTQYVDLLDALDQRLETDVGASSLDEILTLFDRLTFHPSPDAARLQGSAVLFLQRLGSWVRHLDEIQIELARALCNDFGYSTDRLDSRLTEVTSSHDENRPWAHLANRKIGLYSLDESSIRRVKAFLDENIPGIEVVLSSGKVATERLVSAARECEPFVVTSKAAKHAATDAIRTNHGGVPVYSEGKGSASILRALKEWRPVAAP